MIVKGYKDGIAFDLEVSQILQYGQVFLARPDAAEAFEKMRSHAKIDGVEIIINTAFRDYAWQKRLRDRYDRLKKEWDETPIRQRGPAPLRPSLPGWSNHQQGIAFDLRTDGNRWEWLEKNAIEFGFKRTVDHERWHHEFIQSNH